MLKVTGVIAMMLLMVPSAVLAQANVSGQTAARPPSPFMETIVSPIVRSDGSVTFSLRAPQATSVEVRGSFPDPYHPEIVKLTKGADGVWTGSSSSLKSESYSYNFIVDGVTALDPVNAHTRRDGLRISNTVLVPGAAADLYGTRAVPHGTVSQIWYASPTLKKTRRAVIYTPPGYEQSSRRYPVLYLMHGGMGDEDAWISNGRLPQILDSMIAQNRITPLIVVLPNGNGTQTASPDYVEEVEPQGSFLDMSVADSVADDLVPFVDRTFRTRTGRQDRAIAGLSMGGAHALWAAFHHIDKFAWIESMSGGYMIIPGAGVEASIPTDPAIPAMYRLPAAVDGEKLLASLPELTSAANARVSMLALTVGAQDGLLAQQRTVQAALKAHGIAATVTEVPGYSHEWGFWRLALAEMLPKLFRASPPAATAK